MTGDGKGYRGDSREIPARPPQAAARSVVAAPDRGQDRIGDAAGRGRSAQVGGMQRRIGRHPLDRVHQAGCGIAFALFDSLEMPCITKGSAAPNCEGA